MSTVTLFRYLLGDRAAILRIAETRGAVWVGALLVLSAGLAREYDGADLLHEPWRLLIPFAASLGTSWLLYCLVYAAALGHVVESPPFRSTFVSFLSLYWMTAPLAWLYAAPVERFLSAGDATCANLCLLGIVAFWRVLLMTRVVQVLFGASFVAAFWLVMLFSDTVALAILYFTPLPILNIMGGIRLSDSEQVMQAVSLLAGSAGVFSWPVWFLGAGFIIASRSLEWTPMLIEKLPAGNVGRPVWFLATMGILAWAFVLPFTQPEQQLRRAVERDLTENCVAEAIHLMSEHSREDFPPHWTPPPHLAFPQPLPPLVDVLESISDDRCAAWVRTVFLEKLESLLNSNFGWTWAFPDEAERDRVIGALERFQEGVDLLGRYPKPISEAHQQTS